MTVACFSCGAPATMAVAITFRDQPLGDGFVCDGCAGGKAIHSLREEHQRLFREGVAPDLIVEMMRQRVEGARAQA